MGYYTDPTANSALGNINREFSRLEKRAKRLRELRDAGKISPAALKEAQKEFTGLFRHVLTNALNAEQHKEEAPSNDGASSFSVSSNTSGGNIPTHGE